MELYELGLAGAAAGLAQGEFSSLELTRAYLGRVERLNPTLNCYLTVAAESALAAAAAADERRTQGADGPLLGVPLAVKDNIMTVGIRTTAASKMLERYQPSYDATVVAKLKTAGAVVLGKTNLDEWAHGASTENSAFGPTKNPWDTSRVPGGSSGGSAAAVAADLCAAALGSDTGGSIRHPASFCGVVGLKTSYGRVSRSGLLAMTSSTDVIGPMARTVRDAATLLDAIAGPDPRDATTYPEPPAGSYGQALAARRDLSGLTFGVVREWMGEGLTAGVAATVRRALAAVEQAGGTVSEISLPHARYGISVYYVVTPCEVSSNLARYDGIRYGFTAPAAATLHDVYVKSRGAALGPEAKRRIMVGTYALSHGYYDAYYLQAQKVRTIINRELEGALGAVDVLLTPAAPHVAFPVGAQTDNPLKMYLEDVFMSPASLAGLPALVLPAGFAAPEGGGPELPVGVQLVGRRFDEATLLAVANVLEGALGVASARPPLAAR